MFASRSLISMRPGVSGGISACRWWSVVPGRCVMRTSGGDAFSYIGEAAPARGFPGRAFRWRRGRISKKRSRGTGRRRSVRSTRPGAFGSTLTDPEALRVDLVTGIAYEEAAPDHPLLTLNTPGHVSRHHTAQSTRSHGRRRCIAWDMSGSTCADRDDVRLRMLVRRPVAGVPSSIPDMIDSPLSGTSSP